MKKLITAGVIVLAVIIIIFIVGPFYILEEGEQAVIVRFGEVIRTDTDADLKFKVPFVDTVKKYPKKILAWDGAAQIIPTTEGENQAPLPL
jgi:membrane protease subunit HflC